MSIIKLILTVLGGVNQDEKTFYGKTSFENAGFLCY